MLRPATINIGSKKAALVEIGFIAALVTICVVLTTLQSRWTDRLGRETTQQQAGQTHRDAQLLCRAFDTQLSEACNQLIPRAQRVDLLGHESAHAEVLRQWQAAKGRPIFSRMAFVLSEGRKAQLYLIDQKTARATRTSWPPEWNALRENLTLRVTARHTNSFQDRSGVLREYPVFGQRHSDEGSNPGETEWTILELDENYARSTWLPALVGTYLNPGREPTNGVVVKTSASPAATIYSTGRQTAPATVSPMLFSLNGRGGIGWEDPDSEKEYSWTLEVWPLAGDFAATVAGARQRDFMLACVLDGFLVIGGLWLVYYARQARRVGDARMRFLAAVSHELRTPVTVIRAAGHNLRRGIVSDPRRVEKYAGLIIEHSDHLAELVEQVLAFTGARKNTATLARRPVPVAQILRAAISATTGETESAHCRLQTSIPDDLPLVTGDADALKRVFQNLIVNAAKHGAEGGWIGISTNCVPGVVPAQLEVCVSDGGVGIVASEQSRIFEPFFRGSHAERQQTRGSGLGLSVAREIVALHHGSIHVRSEPGEGAIFTVRLPIDGSGARRV